MAAMTLFHAEKCCHLMSEYKASDQCLCSSVDSSWSIVHSYLLIWLHGYGYIIAWYCSIQWYYVMPHLFLLVNVNKLEMVIFRCLFVVAMSWSFGVACSRLPYVMCREWCGIVLLLR